MNFLNDKKNLPIIIAIAAVVIIGAVVSGLYFGGVIGRPAPSPVVAMNPSTPYPGMPTGPGMTGAPGMPGGSGASVGPGVPSGPGARPMGGPMGPGGPMGGPTGIRPGATSRTLSLGAGPSAGEKRPVGLKVAKGHNGKVIGPRPAGMPGMPGPKVADVPVDPNKVTFVGDPTVGPDPFYTKPPPRIKVPGFGKIIVPDSDSNGLGILPPLTPPTSGQLGPDGTPILPINAADPNSPTPDQPVINDQLRRVSGILHSSDGVYAVLETNGVSQTVQPGDDVGGAKVTAIDDNGVTLKTTDTNLVLHVPLSDTASVVNK